MKRTSVLHWTVPILLAALNPAMLRAQSAVADPLAKLNAFAGTWKSQGEMKATAYSKAQANITSDFTCQWAPNHGFLVCDQLVHSPNGTNDDLSIYSYDELKHEYRFFGIGRNDAHVRTPELTIEGNAWVYLGGFDKGPVHVSFRTTNTFISGNNLTWRSEYSEDGTHWTLMGEGTDTKMSGGSPPPK